MSLMAPSLDLVVDVDGSKYSLEELKEAKRHEMAREREAVKPAIRGTRIDADILASWSSGHTLLADNRDNHGTFALSFGELADKINEFLSPAPAYRVPKHKFSYDFSQQGGALTGMVPRSYLCTRCGRYELNGVHE